MTSLRNLWKSRAFHLVAGVFIVLLGLLVIILLIVQGYHADWTGFNRQVEHVPSGQQDYPAKTLWDWLQLLIIPIVLAVGGFLFNFATSRTERKIAAQRYANDQEIALEKQREDLLQSYLDRIGELLLKEDLRISDEAAEVRNVARVRTLTVLWQLDTTRKNVVLSFLREAKLTTAEPRKSIVSLSGMMMSHADFQNVDFRNSDLSEADLSGANLSGAVLFGANLSNADLIGANLIGANFIGADLSGADLSGADLSGAHLGRANLIGTALIKANLRDANLRDADLSGADLSGADLSGADLSKANLVGFNLSNANLIGADLGFSKLSGANLSNANLNNANLGGTDLRGVNLDQVRGATQEQLLQAKLSKTQPLSNE